MMAYSSEDPSYEDLSLEEFADCPSAETQQLEIKQGKFMTSSFARTIHDSEDFPSLHKRHSTSSGSEFFEKPSNSKHRRIGNFYDNYLELGMWPELSYQKTVEIAKKYRDLKVEYSKSLSNIEVLENEAQITATKPCTECRVLEKTQEKTQIALQESIQLTNIMLKEIQRLESEKRKSFI